MKLWEIKAQALRLMFADSDMTFNYTDFTDGILMDNYNTRDKLIRMEDSIARAIDLFYQYCGNIHKKTRVKYKEGTNVLDMSMVLDFGFPTRVDLIANNSNGVAGQEFLYFHFDQNTKDITVDFVELNTNFIRTIDKANFEFLVYYEMKRYNLPFAYDKIEFDLSEIFIPEDVQRAIPKYIKGELYEEDEPNVAMASKNEYINFLINRKKTYSVVSQKVKSKFRRG